MWANFLPPNGNTQNDVDFVSDLIDSLGSRYNVDANKIYSTGSSNGGFMSYELACKLSDKIAAVASVVGSIMPSHIAECDCQHPMPVLQIHGTADSTVTYNGIDGITPTSSMHIDSVIKYWVNFNECDNIPVVTNLPNINLSDSSTVEHYIYSGGNSGTEVEFYKIINGGHKWPSLTATAEKGLNQDFSASVEIWRFFNKNKLSTSIIDHTANKVYFSIYPNPSSSFTISIGDGQPYKLKVFTVYGKQVFEIAIVKEKATFSLNNQVSGLYIYSIETVDGTPVKSGKLVVQN
jgi:polyhydroxybutyrate depolymerase